MQSAQTLAIREGNPQITPEHLLKVLLDDPEGLASGLITKAGGRPKEALERTEAALAKLPKVSGGGAQVHMAPALGRVLDQAEQIADQSRRQLRHRRAGAAGALHGQGGGSPRASSPMPGSRRRRSTPPSTSCARAAPRIRPAPSRPMTR